MRTNVSNFLFPSGSWGEIPHEKGAGVLYSLNNNKLRVHMDKVDTSNGLAFSKDNKILFFIDTLPRKLYAFDYDASTGEVSTYIFQKVL